MLNENWRIRAPVLQYAVSLHPFCMADAGSLLF
jgi:hypothetical protein